MNTREIRPNHRADTLCLLVLILLASLASSCSRKTPDPGASENQKPAESRVKHGVNGEVIITVDAATQKAMGLQVMPLAPAELASEVKAFGRVLDPVALALQVSELAAAHAASQASQAELQRLQVLAGQNNASQRALQAAEAAAARDQLQVQSAHLRLVNSWGPAVADRADLPMFAHSLAVRSNALVQLNLPADEVLSVIPTNARLFTLASNAAPIHAQLLGAASTVDAQMQGQGFIFLVVSNSMRLTPGAAITGYMPVVGQPESGVLLPRQAIVRFSGAAWVYRQISKESFARIEFALQQPLADGWFVSKDLKPRDQIITTGGQLLLSEEQKGQIAE